MYQLLVWNSEHTVCACFMPYVLPAFMCVVVCVHSGHTNTWRISACIYLSLWGSGGTHESILSQWQEVVFSVGLRWDFIWVYQTLPCQGAMLCPGVYLPPCCCFVSPGLKLKRLLLLLIIMQRDLGGGGLWKLYYMVNVCRQLNIWSLHPYVIPEHLIQKTWATICCYNSTSPHVCR